MKNLIYILLLLIPLKGLTQNFSVEEQLKLDSLNVVINNSNSHDTSIVEAYLLLSEILYISNMDTMIPLCEKAKEIAEKSLNENPSDIVRLSLLTKLATASNNIGAVHYNQGDIEKAIAYFLKSLKISEKTENIFAVADGLNNMGIIYYNQGEIEKALVYFHKSLKIREKIGNKGGIANSMNSIGAVYRNQGELLLALQYFQKSLKVREEIGDKEGVAISLTNMGAIHREQGNIKKALENVHQSLKLYEEINNSDGIANCFMWFGSIYNNQADLLLEAGESPEIVRDKREKALEHNLKSLKLFEEIDNKHGIARNLSCIGLYYSALGNELEAKKYTKRSLELAQNLGFPKDVMNAAGLLSKIYEKENKGMQALEMHKLFVQMKDSINSEETQKATAKQQAKYEYEKQKVLDDAAHDKLIAIEKEEKEKQQLITYATGTGLGLVGIFLFFVFNRLQVTRKQKKVIEKQKQEVEHQKIVVETAHHELEEKNQEILDSITYAKRIQSAILPPAKVIKEYLKESFILYKPKDIVAGDFYWMENVSLKNSPVKNFRDGSGSGEQNIILFAAADCTGHGVPGAMVSVVCHNALNRSVREYGLTDPGKILNKTREIVIQEFEKSDEEVKDGMDIALCSLEENKLQYAGANNPLWIIRDGEILETKANKQPIGKFDNSEPYTTHTFELQKGDSIYIFSDGYVDQFGGEKGKKFKAKAFRELLLSIQDKAMEEQKLIIDHSFETWKGNLEQIDDVCIIGVRV